MRTGSYQVLPFRASLIDQVATLYRRVKVSPVQQAPFLTP